MSEATVRLDKWLWAARFFKTRALAKKALEGGKVHYEGSRAKSSRNVEVGAKLSVRQGWSEKTVVVTALAEKRRSAADAATLYCETEESVEKRELEAQQRKLQRAALPTVPQRPTKKQRRAIIRFKNIHDPE